MKDRMIYIGSCVVCLALLGCASEQRRYSGFLRDYSTLEPHPTIPGALVYWNRDIDPRQYTAVLVEPVEVHVMNRNEANRVRPEDMAAFRRFVTDELTATISKYAAIATEPGPNVLRVRLQVADLQFTRPAKESRHPADRPEYALGSADIEIDACDSLSGELVAAYVSPQGRSEMYHAFFLTRPPDPWEAAKTIVHNRIVAWSDLEVPHCVPDVSDTDVAYLTSLQEREPCPGK